MRIAICDDDITVHDKLISYIHTYPLQNMDAFTIDTFTSTDDFLAALHYYDILFMDIYLGVETKTGIEVVSDLTPDQVGCVVFLTTSKEFAVEAFRLNAVHYLIKPASETMVHAALKRCIHKLHDNEESVVRISVSSGLIRIPCRYITYIESLNKRTVIHTDSRMYTTYMTLDSISEQLNPKYFMRAQRSYIVHMGRITDFYYNHILLENGMKITLSRKQQPELRKQYQDYLFQITRRNL